MSEPYQNLRRLDRYCFWCGSLMKGPVPWKRLCSDCGQPPYTPEEYTAMKAGRKHAALRKRDDESEPSSLDR